MFICALYCVLRKVWRYSEGKPEDVNRCKKIQYNGQKRKDIQYNGQKGKDIQYNGLKRKDIQYNGQKRKDKH